LIWALSILGASSDAWFEWCSNPSLIRFWHLRSQSERLLAQFASRGRSAHSRYRYAYSCVAHGGLLGSQS
jgi:hypothetical protein